MKPPIHRRGGPVIHPRSKLSIGFLVALVAALLAAAPAGVAFAGTSADSEEDGSPSDDKGPEADNDEETNTDPD
jgi:hypothetical protein